MRALVTGATGFIGSHLAEHLVAAGHQVRALARNLQRAAHLRDLGVEIAAGDVTDIDSLRAAARGMDVVFHAAARVTDWGPWQEFEAVTVQGTENMLEAAADAGVRRFLQVSTTSVYDAQPLSGQLMHESTPYGRPNSIWGLYGWSKVLAEQAALRYHQEGRLAVSLVRPGSVYGPRDRTFFPRIVQFLRSPTAAWIGDRDPIVSFIYVSDVAEGAVAAATSEKALGQAYNLAPDPEIRLREYIRAVCEELDIPLPRRSYPYALASMLAALSEGWARLTGSRQAPSLTRLSLFLMTHDERCDVSKARRDLGWQPSVPIREGVRRTAEWARIEGLMV